MKRQPTVTAHCPKCGERTEHERRDHGDKWRRVCLECEFAKREGRAA